MLEKSHIERLKNLATIIGSITKIIVPISITVTGALLFCYFFSIQYMPPMTFSTIIYFSMYCFAMISIIFIFIAYFIFLSPKIWLEFVTSLKNDNVFQGQNSAQWSAKEKLISFIGYILAIIFYIYLVVILSNLKNIMFFQMLLWASIIYLLLILKLGCRPIIYNCLKNFKSKKFVAMLLSIQFFLTACACGLVFYFVQAMIVGAYYNNSYGVQSSYFHVSVIAFLIACSSGMIFFEEKETRVDKILSEKFSFSIIITICIFTVLGLYFPVSKSILKTFKMGATSKATILVEKAGCMLIRSGADALNCASINKEEVSILWRQSEYCLQITENGKHRMVILDPSLVKGVSYE